MTATLALPSFLPDYAGQAEERAALQEAMGDSIRLVSFCADRQEPLPPADAICWLHANGYYREQAAFDALLDQVRQAGLPSINSAALTRWNSDKRYLRELESSGIAIVPTRWHERFDADALRKDARAAGWDEIIVKPAVSAGAFHTARLHLNDDGGWQRLAASYPADRAVMLQPFAPEIVDTGEYSFLFFGGVFSHCVLKSAKAGDFRIQHVHGGSYRAADPGQPVLAQARAVFDALPERPVYARIDGILRHGQFLLMEVELIEPYLYSDAAPGSLERMAAVLREALADSFTKS